MIESRNECDEQIRYCHVKFPKENAETKEAFGMNIVEYCRGKTPFPIDCAIVHFRNDQYPWKINRGFYETFFVLEGECVIEFENETVQLLKHDFFVMEPERKHTSRAEFADVMVACTPPFDIKNVEFCEKVGNKDKNIVA